MRRQWRHGTVFLVGFAGALVFYTLAYNAGMSVLEDRPQTLVHSFRVVVESFTTTGYGSDSPWRSPVMNLLVVAMQATGILAVFTALPLFVVPLFENALRTAAPTTVEDLSGHVVICGYSAHGEVLVEELETRGVEYVLVVQDPDRAADLYENGLSVIHGDPEDPSTLRGARVGEAASVVADAHDERNASIVLAAREIHPDVRVVSLVENPSNTDYLRYAGADRVLMPEDILGQSLAGKVTTRISSDISDVVEVGEEFELGELSVQDHSEVVGLQLDESGIRERTGVNVVGIWQDGEFTSPPHPETVLTKGTVLLAAGTDHQLTELKELTRAKTRRHTRGEVVLAGFGQVGSMVADELASADVPVTIVDREDIPGVDVVGDITDEWTLDEADVDDARTVILALPDDTETVFATLVIADRNPEVELVVRANETASVNKLYRAGADYVLSLSTVSGRMLASAILEEEVISLDTQVEVVRTRVPGLVGQSLSEASVRARTGCTVIAVERAGDILTDLGPDFTVHAGDEVVVAGTDHDINEFTTLFAPEDEEWVVDADD